MQNVITLSSGITDGVIGQGQISLNSNFLSDTTPPTGAKFVKLNNATQVSATKVYLSVINDAGANISGLISDFVNIGDSLILFARQDAGQRLIFTITGITDNTTEFEFDVTHDSSLGISFVNTDKIVVSFITASGGGGTGGGTLAANEALVTMGGDDGTGTIGDITKPFATVTEAQAAHRTAVTTNPITTVQTGYTGVAEDCLVADGIINCEAGVTLQTGNTNAMFENIDGSYDGITFQVLGYPNLNKVGTKEVWNTTTGLGTVFVNAMGGGGKIIASTISVKSLYNYTLGDITCWNGFFKIPFLAGETKITGTDVSGIFPPKIHFDVNSIAQQSLELSSTSAIAGGVFTINCDSTLVSSSSGFIISGNAIFNINIGRVIFDNSISILGNAICNLSGNWIASAVLVGSLIEIDSAFTGKVNVQGVYEHLTNGKIIDSGTAQTVDVSGSLTMITTASPEVGANITLNNIIDIPSGGGAGDVTAANPFGTDNSLIRADGTIKGVQSSGIIINDTDDISEVKSLKLVNGEEISWNTDFKTIDIPTGTGSTLQVGQEFYFLVHNDTGVLIPNGSVLKPVASILVGSIYVPTVKLAKSDIPDNCEGTLLIATSDIADGSEGMATRLGRVGGLDTSAFTAGDDIFLSPTIDGKIENVRPSFPDYIITIGGVLKVHATEGEIVVSFSTGVKDTVLSAWDGGFREGFDFTVASNGTVITGSLEQKGGGDLAMIFDSFLDTLDCTPPATIVLTAGTDTIPQDNFIYIPESTRVLTVSTSAFPTNQHIKVANVVLQSASKTQTDDSLSNRNWNDHIKETGDNGHLLHLAERLRRLPASWSSGTEGTLTIVGASTPDDVFIAVTSGVVYELHRQIFLAKDMATGDHIHVVNNFTTPYIDISNLNTQLSDSQGVSLNNTSFSFVLWGLANKSGEASHLMLNLPSGSYSFISPSDAVADADNKSDYTIPSIFNGNGFLIARYTLTYKNDVWTLEDTEDLRGKIPNTSAGGGSGGSGVTTFAALTDTPSSYVGQAKKFPKVNVGETDLEYALIIEEEITGTRLTNASVTGIQTLDWDLYKVFDFTLTGNTTITDTNLPTGVDTKVIEKTVSGDFTLTFPAYYTPFPSNDAYDGTKDNHIVITCINGTAASEIVYYSLQNMT